MGLVVAHVRRALRRDIVEAELEGMAPRDVRKRRAERNAYAQRSLIRLSGTRDAAAAIQQARNQPSLIDDWNEQAFGINVRGGGVCILFAPPARPRLDENSVGWRCSIGHRSQVANRILDAVGGFLRDDRRGHRAPATPVLIVEEVELVRLVRLPCEPEIDALFGRIIDGALVGVRHVRPFRDVPFVEILEETADVIGLTSKASRRVEPQLILLEWTA